MIHLTVSLPFSTVFRPRAAAEKQAPGAHPLYSAPDMPLTLPRRDAKNHAAKTTKDLTDHPWAGTMVRLTLKAKDDAQNASPMLKPCA